jgi:hypothetical protein
VEDNDLSIKIKFRARVESRSVKEKRHERIKVVFELGVYPK